jgi:glyoxylase-like metal-dependent hydrolase (beta-lactamase superfamily II)
MLDAFDPTPERLSERVWRLPHAMAGGNYALVMLPDGGAMAVDTGTTPGDAARAEALARALGRDLTAVLYTHHHYDHVLGGRGGSVGTVLAHARFPAAFDGARDQIAAHAGVAPRGEDGLDGIVHAPDILLDPCPRLALPEFGIEVIASPGHCGDHVSVLVPDDDVLITADAVVTAIPPAFPSLSSSDTDWLATLDRLSGLAAGTLLPGHGPVLKGAGAVAEWIGVLRVYLGSLHDGIAAMLDESMPAEAIPPRFLAEAYLPPPLLRSPYDPVARHGRTLGRMIEMAVARRTLSLGAAG